MFPAVVSSKLEAAIAREEIRKRKRIQAEKGKGEGLGEKKGPRVSEFEMLLNEYSKIEADEIAVRASGLAAVGAPVTHQFFSYHQHFQLLLS